MGDGDFDVAVDSSSFEDNRFLDNSLAIVAAGVASSSGDKLVGKKKSEVETQQSLFVEKDGFGVIERQMLLCQQAPQYRVLARTSF